MGTLITRRAYRRKAKAEEEEKLRKWTRETAVARKKLAAQQAQARMHVSNVAQAKMAQMQRQQQQQGGKRHWVFCCFNQRGLLCFLWAKYWLGFFSGVTIFIC